MAEGKVLARYSILDHVNSKRCVSTILTNTKVKYLAS